MPRLNKTQRTNGNRKIVSGVQKHLNEPITMQGVQYTPGKLARMFQEGIALADASDAATKAWRMAVTAEQSKAVELADLQARLRTHVISVYGEDSAEFTDFGFVPRKVTTPDAATKAEAVVKRGKTRAARRTMGSRQRAEVTGETEPATNAQPAPAPAVAKA
jgi:hypothetical protein